MPVWRWGGGGWVDGWRRREDCLQKKAAIGAHEWTTRGYCCVDYAEVRFASRGRGQEDPLDDAMALPGVSGDQFEALLLGLSGHQGLGAGGAGQEATGEAASSHHGTGNAFIAGAGRRSGFLSSPMRHALLTDRRQRAYLLQRLVRSSESGADGSAKNPDGEKEGKPARKRERRGPPLMLETGLDTGLLVLAPL